MSCGTTYGRGDRQNLAPAGAAAGARREQRPWRQEGSQPPLYYAMGAALTFWIDTSDMEVVRQPNPHARAGEIRWNATTSIW